MAKARSQYRCSECHHVTAKWVGRCLECGAWGTIDEVAVVTALSGAHRRATVPASVAVPISSVEPHRAGHCPTGVSEFDRVLGGGVVPGSVTLLAGDPGAGKSTLLLKVAHRWAQPGRRALYVSGEESAGQIRMRADRTGCSHDEVYLAAESDLHAVLVHIEEVQPTLVVIDSVQTISTTEVDGVTGGVTQVRAVTTALTAAAKMSGVAMVLVGHVTKEGSIAGPRSLEHLVDVVLVPGTAITVTLDGKRPLIGEVQALLATPANGSPRRAVSGIDHARAAMVTAVLEKHGRLRIAANDVYLSTVGGMRLTDPSTDLAIAIALASAYATLPLPTNAVIIADK